MILLINPKCGGWPVWCTAPAGCSHKNVLNTPGDFYGTIEHRENIGKTSDDLVVLWNEDHLDDPAS